MSKASKASRKASDRLPREGRETLVRSLYTKAVARLGDARRWDRNPRFASNVTRARRIDRTLAALAARARLRYLRALTVERSRAPRKVRLSVLVPLARGYYRALARWRSYYHASGQGY